MMGARRWIIVVGVTVAAITAGAVATLAPDGGEATLSAAGNGTQVTGVTSDGTPTTTSPATSQPSTTAASPQVTAAPRATTTQPAVATTATTTPTITPPHPPLCDASMVAVTAMARQASYRVGDTIVLEYRATNRSGAECLYPRYRLYYEVTDESGKSQGRTRLDDPSPGGAYPDLPAFYYHRLAPTGYLYVDFGYPGPAAGTLTFRISTETFGAAAPVTVTVT